MTAYINPPNAGTGVSHKTVLLEVLKPGLRASKTLESALDQNSSILRSLLRLVNVLQTETGIHPEPPSTAPEDGENGRARRSDSRPAAAAEKPSRTGRPLGHGARARAPGPLARTRCRRRNSGSGRILPIWLRLA